MTPFAACFASSVVLLVPLTSGDRAHVWWAGIGIAPIIVVTPSLGAVDCWSGDMAGGRGVFHDTMEAWEV